MTRLTRRPRAGRLIGLTFMGRLTILAIVISMARLTGGDKLGWLYRLGDMAAHTRMTRMVTPTSRHRFIRGWG